MKKIIQPNYSEWKNLVERPVTDVDVLDSLVNKVFSEIQKVGDKALISFTEKFDKVKLKSLTIDTALINASSCCVDKKLKKAIDVAVDNITKFHKAQIEKAEVIETTKGVKCWRESRPIDCIGIYIPGGSAPLFSTVLMLAIPAKIAGCKDIVLCSPPERDGAINPVILYVANLIGISKIFPIGGIQAIGAMAYGTKSVPRVDKIFGPGNQYVTAAKQRAQQLGIAIDMPAGPSEVLIIADEFADADFVAADLLSQAEHGVDSQVILLSTSDRLIQNVFTSINQQLKKLARKTVAQEALKNSSAILFQSVNECIGFSNLYAPEHLILAVKNAKQYTDKISNAGSVFLGSYSCESAGDYASGTNHTLPTNGYARNYSGVSVDSFVKKITFQKISKKGILNLGPSIEIMAEAEQLMAHKNAVSVRLKKLKS